MSAWPVMNRGVSPGSTVGDSISGERLLPLRLGWRGCSASATGGRSPGGRQGELLTVPVLFWVALWIRTVLGSVAVTNATLESSANKSTLAS